MEALRGDFVVASQAEARWRIRADELLRRAVAAEQRLRDLLLQILGAGGFARQTGVGAGVLSLHGDLAVLGLRWPCTSDEVNKAYRALAMQHHPDRGGDADVFNKVQAAYDRVQEAFDLLGAH